MQNLTLAFRRLLKSPFVSTIAVISLALGIGANAAIFSVFNEMLLRPLPVPAPVELVNFGTPGPKQGSTSCDNTGTCDEILSYPMFRDLEAQQTVFTGIAGHRRFGANIGYRNETREGGGLLVSGSYFEVLGLQPALGRLINRSDDPAPGESPVVVLSHDYWQRRFESDIHVIGEPLVVNGTPMTIIGVAPERFHGTSLGSRPLIYVPITLRGQVIPRWEGFDNRLNHWVYAFARLKPGVSIDQARTATNVLYRSIVREVEAPLQTGMSDVTMREFLAKELTVESGRRGQSQLNEDTRTPLTLLLVVTGVVVLIACANVANLLLARSAARSVEMAVRLSIGASRWSLVGQLLAESMVLAVIGGLAGLLVAQWTLQGVMAMMPPEAAQDMLFQLDGTALLFTAAIALGTGVLFGIFPALHASRPNLLQTIKGSTGQPSGSKSAAWFRVGLATFQITVSMALLGLSGLFVKSLFNISHVDLGLDVDNVVTFRLSPQRNGYPLEQSRQLFLRLEEELRAQPGVTGVTSAIVPLLAGSNWGNNVSVQGFDAGPDTDTNSRLNYIGPDYFRTVGIPVLSGREFLDTDTNDAPRVVIVNEAFARKFNLGRNAVGKRMEAGHSGSLNLEIVGLVQDAKYSEVKDEVPPVFFLPYRQTTQTSSMNFYVRTALDPAQFAATIPPLVAGLDPNLPVEGLLTMPEQVRQNVFGDRIVSQLTAAFATLATVLAAVGLYGVLAYTVAQRTREFGLRLALGADPRRVRWLVMRRVAWMTLAGTLVGIGLAVAGGLAAQSVLYELQGYDPGVLAASALLMVLVALAAGFLPALRASRVDPMQALRYE